ncbi:MAG: hypothetical protein F8N36_13760 [Desulfovibrio sp.]|uniref:hypothetical protein n=1 Tax=Desulfovibrio sp. TaxID=885 RepID=UPI00135DF848|nr:hypothetical protein [Desulfovibrio sp.]MTJ93904.1 hypothetical protein [Desulfovibrio sp.]
MHASPTDEEADVLRRLAADESYEQISAAVGKSRGWVYSVAVRHRARKNEARIRERQEDRRRRQLEFMASVLNTTTSADVSDFFDGVPDSSVQVVVTSPPYRLASSRKAVYCSCSSGPPGTMRIA